MYTGFSTEIVEKSLLNYSQNEQNIDSDGLGYIFMIRQRIEQVWYAIPAGIRRVLKCAVGFVGFITAIAFNNENDSEDEENQSVYGSVGLFNHNTGKFDDGTQAGGMYGEPYDNLE